MRAPRVWRFAAYRQSAPLIGQHAHGLCRNFIERGLLAVRREFWPTDKELEEWLNDQEPFP